MNGNNKALIFITILVLVVTGVFWFVYGTYFQSPYAFKGTEPIKIFHLNSYNIDFPLVARNIDAFKTYFEEQGIPVEIEEFEMNTLVDESEENIQQKTEEALAAIASFKPDLIYATDDNAQKYVISPYFRNTDIPVVFSGVNGMYEDFGYDQAKNVTGVYERLHFVETVELLQTIYPSVRNIVVVADDFAQWQAVMDRFKGQVGDLPHGITVASWDTYASFADFKEGVVKYQQEGVDAIVSLGLTQLADENGRSVPLTTFSRWTVEHVQIPTATFWDFSVENGLDLAAQVSDVAQGTAAARIAKDILIDGVRPRDIAVRSTTEIERSINLRRTGMFGVTKDSIPSSILINADIFTTFPWEK